MNTTKQSQLVENFYWDLRGEIELEIKTNLNHLCQEDGDHLGRITFLKNRASGKSYPVCEFHLAQALAKPDLEQVIIFA